MINRLLYSILRLFPVFQSPVEQSALTKQTDKVFYSHSHTHINFWSLFLVRTIQSLFFTAGIGYFGLISTTPCSAQVSVRTSLSNEFKPIPLAVVGFSGEGDLGERITSIIHADLQRSGYFILLPPEKFPETPAFDTPPDFALWQETGVRAILVGNATRDSSGRLKAEFRLWDPLAESQLAGQQFFTDPAYWRRISHIIADAVYSITTGFKGFFDTRIAFIDETGSKENRRKRLAIMDQDGMNVRYLTKDESLIVSPRYSPVAQDITFMSQRQAEQPRVQIINVDTGARQIVGNFPDMSSSPRFSPDGKKIIMSLQNEGNANIYLLDLETRTTTRITDTNAIDTSPSFSPDGSRIVFESDRGGSQQIYIMNADGSNPQRLVFGEGSYSQPVWSPRGDYIAFTRRRAGRFGIGVIKPDGTGEQILTEGYHNESPAWAPNGQYVIFFRDPGGQNGGRLFMVDLFGLVETEIPTPSFASDPSWSPLLSSGN